MKVLFKHVWFGPSEVAREGKINESSGRRYRPGVHFVPSEFKSLLPKTAKIIEDDAPEPAPGSVAPNEPGLTLRDFDEARTAGDEAAKKAEEAEAQLRANAEKLRKELEAEEAPKPFKKKFGKE